LDWKIFSATFTAIFIAELGDKTQFAALAISSQTKSTLSVLLATVLALALAGAIGVLFGALLGKYIDPEKMRYISGASFIAMGIWILAKAP
jgi:putative Ca2+/H+ antiporter (TMEM165/GDT1 family)